MAKFCRFCGTDITENRDCNCSNSMNDNTKKTVQPTIVIMAPSAFKVKTKEIFSIASDYIKNPALTTRSIVKNKKISIALIFVVIKAVLAGLFLFSFAHKFLSDVGYSVESLTRPLAEIFLLLDYSPQDIGYWSPEFSIPFFNVMIFGILFVVITYILSSIIIYIVSRLTGSNSSFQDIMIGLGVNTLFTSLCIAISSIVIFISFNITFYLFIFGVITWIVTIVLAAESSITINKDGKFYALLIIGIFILSILSAYVFCNILPAAYGNIEVDGTRLATWFNQLARELKGYVG